MSIDIAAELRSWCIDNHLPSGASEGVGVTFCPPLPAPNPEVSA